MPKVIGNHSMIALCMISCAMLSVFRLWIKADSCAACGNKSSGRYTVLGHTLGYKGTFLV